MKIASTWTTEISPQAAEDALDELLRKLGGRIDFLVVHCTAKYDTANIIKILHQRAGGIPLHGGTSALGVMTESGFHSENNVGLGLFGISDPDGSYGVAAAAIGDDPMEAAKSATQAALLNAKKAGDTPALVWITAAPGQEEVLIRGIAMVLGDQVPVAGGSSADNDVRKDQQQFANDQVYRKAIVVSVLFPSTEVISAFQGPYEPTKNRGVVTKAKGRLLLEIDRRPAALVYNEWADGLINEAIQTKGNVLVQTSRYPLGRVVGRVGGAPYFQLAHPGSVTNENGLTLYSEVSEGNEIALMTGKDENLLSCVDRVIPSTLDMYNLGAGDIAGVLMVYCAGCLFAVKGRIGEVADNYRHCLPNVPMLGTFSAGEQGCFAGGENRHGNFMMSLLLFSRA